jgi:hypothetical protein
MLRMIRIAPLGHMASGFGRARGWLRHHLPFGH